MSRRAILVTGGTGQVGTGIGQHAGDFDIVAPTRAQLNLGDPAAIDAAVAARDWGAVINCAAYTAVDKAESEPEAAFAINAEAPRILAEATARRDIPLLHVSTDYVFDGAKPVPYVEEDPVAPLGVYGATKEAGEQAVRASNPRHIILRTAWVVSPWGNNFVKTMLRLGAERPKLGIVADQIGCPTSAQDIADTLLAIAADPHECWGTYHFVNAGQASWFDLASTVFAHAAAAGKAIPVIDPITTADYPTPAKRPANSRLSTALLTRTFGITPRRWQDALDDIMAPLLTQQGTRS